MPTHGKNHVFIITLTSQVKNRFIVVDFTKNKSTYLTVPLPVVIIFTIGGSTGYEDGK